MCLWVCGCWCVVYKNNTRYSLKSHSSMDNSTEFNFLNILVFMPKKKCRIEMEIQQSTKNKFVEKRTNKQNKEKKSWKHIEMLKILGVFVFSIIIIIIIIIIILVIHLYIYIWLSTVWEHKWGDKIESNFVVGDELKRLCNVIQDFMCVVVFFLFVCIMSPHYHHKSHPLIVAPLHYILNTY